MSAQNFTWALGRYYMQHLHQTIGEFVLLDTSTRPAETQTTPACFAATRALLEQSRIGNFRLYSFGITCGGITDELRQLGVFWLTASGPTPPRAPGRPLPAQAQDVFLTRLHVRYDAEHFPEDLTFQETADRANFQGRYILRHPWQGTETCREAEQYRASLPPRWDQEARMLASLTGWNLEDIREKIPSNGSAPDPQQWWRKLWKD